MACAVQTSSEGFAERFGERLFANKINPKKRGFQCSLTHIFQHFPISVLPLCPIITFYSYFPNCPRFLIFIAKFDGFSTMWAMLLCCLQEKAPSNCESSFYFCSHNVLFESRCIDFFTLIISYIFKLFSLHKCGCCSVYSKVADVWAFSCKQQRSTAHIVENLSNLAMKIRNPGHLQRHK